MFPATVPFEHELGPGVTLELAPARRPCRVRRRRPPWRPDYWLEARLVAFLRTQTAGV